MKLVYKCLITRGIHDAKKYYLLRLFCIVCITGIIVGCAKAPVMMEQPKRVVIQPVQIASTPVEKPAQLDSSIIREKDGAVMMIIPAGEFLMGSPENIISSELPQHVVFLEAFYIDKYEITNAQYKQFMDATGHKAPSYWDDPKYNAPTQPVVGVSWDDARAYAEWAGAGLPTEAEWEKAARGGLVEKKYPWGDSISHDDANYSGTGGKDKWEYTSPVGSFDPNGYGLYDMAGNVWEWCADWYDSNYYVNSPKSNPKGPDSGSDKVLRGGSWYDGDDGLSLRVAYRFSSGTAYFGTSYDNFVGFRCAQ